MNSVHKINNLHNNLLRAIPYRLNEIKRSIADYNMVRKKRSFSREFKIEVIEENEQGIKQVEICRKYNFHLVLIKKRIGFIALLLVCYGYHKAFFHFSLYQCEHRLQCDEQDCFDYVIFQYILVFYARPFHPMNHFF